MMTADDPNNGCPEFAPVDPDTGFVWCDCMNEFSHVIMAASQNACLRTEGLSDDQAAAYEAAGINVVDYTCQCCTCQSILVGVPKVGEAGKQCDAGSLNPDENGCGDSSYYMFAAALSLLIVVVVVKKLQPVEEKAKPNGKKTRGNQNALGQSLSGDSENRPVDITKKGSFKSNPLMHLSSDDVRQKK